MRWSSFFSEVEGGLRGFRSGRLEITKGNPGLPLRHGPAEIGESGEIRCVCVTRIGGAVRPGHGLGVVFVHTLAIPVARRQIKLGAVIAVCSAFSQRVHLNGFVSKRYRETHGHGGAGDEFEVPQGADRERRFLKKRADHGSIGPSQMDFSKS